MRDGQYITSMNFRDTTMDEIISNMVGREIKEKFPRVNCEKGKKVFEVKHLNAGRMVRDISFELHEGEIVGFAGLMGAGRTETTRAIFGADPKESGEIMLDGQPVRIHKVAEAIRAGIVLAPEDRKKDGLCTKLSLRHNIALPNLDILCNRCGVVRHKNETDMCTRAVDNLMIKTRRSKGKLPRCPAATSRKWSLRNGWRAIPVWSCSTSPHEALTWPPRWRFTT